MSLDTNFAPSLTKAPAFSNAFAAPQLKAIDDELLESPLGVSPLSLATSSPFDASFCDDLSPMISGTPDLMDDMGDMPSLFQPWPSTIAMPFIESGSAGAAVSPQMMTLDKIKSSSSSEEHVDKPPVEVRIARAREVAQQVLAEDQKPVKDKFTGTRNTKLPMIDMDAPTMSRSWVIPASTSRKRASSVLADVSAPSKAASSPASKKRATGRGRKASVTPSITADEAEEIDDLPDEVLTAIELKRRQNTLAARRSRQRKANHLAELSSQIESLQAEVSDWKAKYAELEQVVRQLRGQA